MTIKQHVYTVLLLWLINLSLQAWQAIDAQVMQMLKATMFKVEPKEAILSKLFPRLITISLLSNHGKEKK